MKQLLRVSDDDEDDDDGASVHRYTYGRPVQGHLNMTFIYYFHGTRESSYEDREVCVIIPLIFLLFFMDAAFF